MNVLGVDRAGLYARTSALTATEARSFGRALCQRCEGVPLQHLTGEQPFRHLALEVRPGVFIPRPETEVLVDVGVACLADIEHPIVADLGTGTGAIALAIKHERPDATVYGADLSSEAVSLAMDNAARLGLEVTFHEGDLYDALPGELAGRLALVVSNPPYVTPEEYEGLPVEVLADPELALLGGPEVYARIASGATRWLRPDGWLAVEIGSSAGEEVAALMVAAGFVSVEISEDLARRDRIVSGRLPEGGAL